MNTEHFAKLPQEKRLAIQNAAFACFGKDGYAKTAMSEIAAMAGVSKASLFHYFGTKMDLYTYLFRLFSDELLTKMECGTEDFIESILIGARMKLAVMAKHPNSFQFFSSLIKEEDTLIAELQKINVEGINDGVRRLFAHVDWNRLRPGVSVEEAHNLAYWVNEGYAKACADKRDGDAMFAELSRYLLLLKKALYKEEYW